jgi:pimeloyl-ACP methyl ester carboxylesterase
VLLHGAGSGPWVFDGWREALGGFEVAVPDLQAGLNVAEAAMSNYAAVAVRAAEVVPAPRALVGWSSGGLAAMLAARPAEAARLVLVEASPPAEVQGEDPSVEPVAGTFDPEETYGPFPPGMRARPESSFARAERKRGISVPELPCPALVISGREFPEERGSALAARYSAEELRFPSISHWELVLDPEVAEAVARSLS